MAIYFLQVATRGSEHDYQPLLRLLDAAGAQPMLEGSWVFEAAHPIREMLNIIADGLAKDDAFFLIEVAPNTPWSAVRLPRASAQWLHNQRP